MAHKKGGGTTRNGRDSESKRLGVKVYGGERVNAALKCIRAKMSAWARITPCSH